MQIERLGEISLPRVTLLESAEAEVQIQLCLTQITHLTLKFIKAYHTVYYTFSRKRNSWLVSLPTPEQREQLYFFCSEDSSFAEVGSTRSFFTHVSKFLSP
jgi:hypothetical protein